MSERLRVIQWGTGNVGHEALRGILESPELELAGVLVYTAEKDGADAVALCGLPPCGVRATRDRAAILRTRADCVVYAPRHAQLDEVCEILRSGKNVVATPFLFYPPSLSAAELATQGPADPRPLRRAGGECPLLNIDLERRFGRPPGAEASRDLIERRPPWLVRRAAG